MSSISNLPNHILEEILCNLPVTTLIECRYVCRSWRNILANPTFAKLHQQLTDVLLCVQDDVRRPSRNHIYWLEFQGKFNCCNLETKFKVSGQKLIGMQFINSCNGLVCLRLRVGFDKYVMHISNPVTGESMILPLLHDEENGLYSQICSLGFSRKANQFKAIRILFEPEYYERGNSQALAHVCTLGTGSWRSVGFAPRYHYSYSKLCFLHYRYRHVFVNESIHWLVGRLIDNGISFNYLEICAFDFDTEQFRTFPAAPQVLEGNSTRDISTFGDSLCMYFQTGNKLKIDVWVMKEYGVAESWTKIFVIEDSYELKLNNFLKNGNILLRRCNNMFLYNPRNKIFTELDTHGVIFHNGESGACVGSSKWSYDKCFVHKPSFVSLRDMIWVDNSKV